MASKDNAGDRLPEIAAQDSAFVAEMNAAVDQMLTIGVTAQTVAEWLSKESAPEWTADFAYAGPMIRNMPFHGFVNRRQAVLAVYSCLPKKDWPAQFQAIHERVKELIKKKTEAPKDAVTAILIVPAVITSGLPPKILERLPGGEVIDVEAEEEASEYPDPTGVGRGEDDSG